MNMQPLYDFIASAEFVKLKADVEALPADMMADMGVGPHIMALRSGLNGLARAAPKPAAPDAHDGA